MLLNVQVIAQVEEHLSIKLHFLRLYFSRWYKSSLFCV